jgi:hypothetical protein
LANQFFRKPIIGGDNNTWATFNDAWIRSSIGEYTTYLFDNAGTLTLSPGRVGINDGVNEGMAIIDANTTITITGTNGRWYKIELSVSGTSVTIASSVLAGADASTLPTQLTAGYVTTKQGFYDDSSKRLLGVVWKNAAGTLAGIINCGNMIKGYSGYAYLNTGLTDIMRWDKKIDICKRWVECNPTTTWDMDTSSYIDYQHNLGAGCSKIKSIILIILQNGGAGERNQFGSYDDGTTTAGISYFDSTVIRFIRASGGGFDSATYNAAILKIIIELQE